MEPSIVWWRSRLARLRPDGWLNHALARLQPRAGNMADYQQLAGFHYLAGPPAAFCRVLVLEDVAPCPDEWRPWLAAASPDAHRPAVVALLVESPPVRNCGARNAVFGDRYAGGGRGGRGSRWLCDQVRCISRVIVHPRWRGLGLAARLVRWALATRTTPVVEALAAMGAIHPFLERAGMTRHALAPGAAESRLLAALQHAGLTPADLIDEPTLRGALRDPKLEPFIRREIARFGSRLMPFADKLRLARRRLTAKRIYYFHIDDEPAHQAAA